MSFVDRHWVRIPGGQGVVDVTTDVIYLAISLRNVGSGMAVLHSWVVDGGAVTSAQRPDHAPLDQFRRLTRDLFVPPGEVFFWQAALRDPTEAAFAEVVQAVRSRSPLTVELLYGDEEGGQRTVTRYSLLPHTTEDAGLVWLPAVSRHWNIDRADPR